jgi:pimeloyl-ACP methyl ester carboxylesterase
MRKIQTLVAFTLCFSAITAEVVGQDFGSILKRATREALRKELGAEVRVPGGAGRVAEPELHNVRTADGWTLVAHRYKPAGGASTQPPVILCHGLTYNAEFWDLDPACSLATYLAGQGYDVWAIDLRGSGLSEKWVYRLDDAPEVLIGGALRRASKGKLGSQGYQTVDPKAANWSLDHHIAYDVPAFVKLVRARTGAAQVSWVGHSMGGIVALCHLARYQNPGIGRLVTVGSQVTMEDGQLVLPFLEQMLVTRQRQMTGEVTTEALLAQTRTSVHNLFFNVSHVDPKIYTALSGPATDVPAVGLMRQYMDLATKGQLTDSKGTFSYARALGNINVPILISCGAQDRFAPPSAQKFLYDHVGSTDKTLLIFGAQHGFAAESGHDDALVGRTSRQQVYPVVDRWLRGQKP